MDEENLIVLNDEDGNEIEFEFLDLISYRQKEYVVLLPLKMCIRDRGLDGLLSRHSTLKKKPFVKEQHMIEAYRYLKQSKR